MTIQSSLSKALYYGDGNSVNFAFNFKVFNEGQITVTVADNEGNYDVVEADSISLNSDGTGTVVYTLDGAPLPEGHALAITRDMDFLQEKSFSNAAKFDATVVEACLDQACAERQQILEKIDRAVILPATSSETPESVVANTLTARDAAANSASAAATSATASASSANAAATSETNAAASKTAAASSAITAQTWAESETAPDPNNAESKSAKTWALIAGDSVPIASTNLAGKAKTSASWQVDSETGVATVPDATTELAGIARQATDVEVAAGTEDGPVFVTPYDVQQKIDALATDVDEDLEEHNASLTAHDALVQRITVGSLSPVIGIVCVENGGGAGLWFTCDEDGQPISPSRSYFDYHPTYKALRKVLVDDQVMVEHTKFYYKAMTVASGPFAGKHARIISPTARAGFKAFPSFMKDGVEIDKWYCGTYQATDQGGTPKKLGSRPGKTPFVNVNFTTMRQYCQNRNVDGVTGFDMWNIYQVAEIQLLALIEMGASDSQAAYGMGRVSTTSANYVDAADVAVASWRGHIGLWGNVWQMCNGLQTDASRKVLLWKNDGSEEFVNTNFVAPTASESYLATLKTGASEDDGWDFDNIFFPETVGAYTGASIPDGWWIAANSVPYIGGDWADGGLAGLFACSLYDPISCAYVSIGCRLARY